MYICFLRAEIYNEFSRNSSVKKPISKANVAVLWYPCE